MSSVSKKTGVSKKATRDRRMLAKAQRENGGEKPVSRIKEAAKRAGIEPKEPPLDETPVTLPRYALQRLDRLLARAQDVVMRAPATFNYGIPPLGGLYGSSAAVSAHSDIRIVRDELAKAMGGAS